MSRGLTEENREALRNIDSQQWESIAALCASLKRNQEKALLKYDLSNGDRGLSLLKAQLDGASCIIDGIARAQAQLRKEK